jgi:hypothetical protein
MPISAKTRKLLWGRSGNRCAYCRCELIMAGSVLDGHSVIGDECHIIAKHLNGPRGSVVGISEVNSDDVSNLILLCKVHHKMIDDQPNKFTVDALKKMKAGHEKWVHESLSRPAAESETVTSSALRITGKDVVSLLSQAYVFDFDHDELDNTDEIQLVGGFFQNAQDWGDIASEVDSSWRVKMAFELSQDVKNLENRGFCVFGTLQKRKFKVLDQIEVWPVAVLRVVRNTNPSIKSIGDITCCS